MFYGKAAHAIEELNPDQLIGQLEETIEFLEPFPPFINQLVANTEWGEHYIEFLNSISTHVKFILEQNINLEESKDYKDWSVDDLIKPLDDLVKMSGLYLVNDLLKHEDRLSESVLDTIRLGESFLDFVENLEPNNEISQTFVDGLTFILSKCNAFLSFLQKSHNIEHA